MGFSQIKQSGAIIKIYFELNQNLKKNITINSCAGVGHLTHQLTADKVQKKPSNVLYSEKICSSVPCKTFPIFLRRAPFLFNSPLFKAWGRPNSWLGFPVFLLGFPIKSLLFLFTKIKNMPSLGGRI